MFLLKKLKDHTNFHTKLNLFGVWNYCLFFIFNTKKLLLNSTVGFDKLNYFKWQDRERSPDRSNVVGKRFLVPRYIYISRVNAAGSHCLYMYFCVAQQQIFIKYLSMPYQGNLRHFSSSYVNLWIRCKLFTWRQSMFFFSKQKKLYWKLRPM